MAGGGAGGDDRLGPGIRAARGRAWLTLVWERLWCAVWPAAAVAGFFIAASLFDLWRLLPGWLHLAGLAAFAAMAGAALWRGLAGFRFPDAHGVERRLEVASGLGHRPLAALGDALAGGGGDPVAESLWRAHRRRVRAAIRSLRTGAPAPGLARRDPFALRAVPVLVLALAVMASWGEGPERMERGVTPSLWGPPEAAGAYEVWLLPPQYTGLEPVFVDPPRGDKALVIPAGSRLSAHVHGGNKLPELRLGAAVTPFTALDARDYEASITVDAGDALTITQGGAVLATWPLSILPDRPPGIDFADPPTQTASAVLRLEYKAKDDYGLVRVMALLRRVEPPDGTDPASAVRYLDGEPMRLSLAISGLDPAESRAAGYYDLTAHPWAGLPVALELAATDALDQTGRSQAMPIHLPERRFTQELAQAIIAERKRLITSTSPEERLEIALALQYIGVRALKADLGAVVTLGLVTGAARLLADRRNEAVDKVQRLLWNLALRVEDGDLSIAERDLRDLQQALMEALAGDATDAEIDRLMDELRETLDRYLHALMENMSQFQAAAGERSESIAPEGMPIDRQDLQRLIEQARELIKGGAREQAEELLAQLRELLENMRAGMEQNKELQQGEAGQIMKDLRDLMDRQGGLLDDTFRRAQNQGGPNSPEGFNPGGRLPDVAQVGLDAQEALRRFLGEVMRRFGELSGQIPSPLGRAEREMRDAAAALARDRPGQAVNPQSRAIEQMQRGAEAMIQQLAEQFGVGGPENATTGEGFGPGRDPMGRPLSGTGGASAEDVRIPDRGELRRAREILEELRRRSGDQQRPRFELEYIDRLLPRF
jgi:uncharacterized protein (TIGR02302 family)